MTGQFTWTISWHSTHARKLREYGVKYVWISSGDVLMREKDGSRVQRIDSTHHVERIMKNLTYGEMNHGASPKKRRRSNEEGSEQPAKRSARHEHRAPNAERHSHLRTTGQRSYNDAQTANTRPVKQNELARNNNSISRVQQQRQNCYVLLPMPNRRGRGTASRGDSSAWQSELNYVYVMWYSAVFFMCSLMSNQWKKKKQK